MYGGDVTDGPADLHAHILPDLDDGPRGLGRALALLRLFAADGVATIVATPHVHPEHPGTLDRRDGAFRQLVSAAAHDRIDVELVLGGEVDPALALTMDDDALARCAFGSGRVLLLEFPWTYRWPAELAPAVDRAVALGLSPLIAHPERIDVWSHDLDLLVDLRQRGAAIQLTAGSPLGEFGRREADLSDRLLAEDLVDVVASDAHGPHRPPRMTDARDHLRRRYGADVAARLVDEEPRRLLRCGVRAGGPAA